MLMSWGEVCIACDFLLQPPEWLCVILMELALQTGNKKTEDRLGFLESYQRR